MGTATRTAQYEERRIACPRCGRAMTPMQECHLLCEGCGLQLDCSDKGLIW